MKKDLARIGEGPFCFRSWNTWKSLVGILDEDNQRCRKWNDAPTEAIQELCSLLLTKDQIVADPANL